MTNTGEPFRFDHIMWPDDDHLEQARRAALAPLSPPNLLFYGPPGTGKTSAMRAIAVEGLHAMMPHVETFSDALATGDVLVVDHEYGYGASRLRSLQDWGSLIASNEQGRKFLLIDEFDAYSNSAWNQVKTLLDKLRRMDVRVMAATNHLSKIDPAARNRFRTIDMNFQGSGQRQRMRDWLGREVDRRGLPAMPETRLVGALNRAGGSMRSLMDEVAAWEFRHRGLKVLAGGDGDE